MEKDLAIVMATLGHQEKRLCHHIKTMAVVMELFISHVISLRGDIM